MKYREIQKQEEPKPQKPQGKRAWLVEISLTSGKSIQFYVTTKTQFDAYEKADGYVYWLGDPKLSDLLGEFRLRP
jgi:hypothetical protein